MNGIIIAITMAALVTAGCGGGDEPAAAGEKLPQVAACDLFTAADVEAVFGAPARANVEQNDEDLCGYWAPGTSAAGITLQVKSGREFASSWASDEMRGTAEVEDVEGLGEAAVWLEDMGFLVALENGRTLVLGGSGSLDEKRTLMERVLDRN